MRRPILADAHMSSAGLVEGLRLLERIGQGGEGEVWEARDSAGRPRACKLIRPDALADPQEVERRAHYLRRIDHPALVRVYRSGVLTEGRLQGWGFVEMDLVEGQPLDQAPPDPDAIERLAPLAEALDLLHAGKWSSGVALLHRDVKPGNLLETADGDIVLVDPSTLRGLDLGPHTRVGTPLFCAPEVLRGKVTPAADIYSFAATLVALASGTRGDELAELLDDPRDLNLPSGVRRALSPRPSDRPQSCRAVLSAAEELTRAFPDAEGWLVSGVGGTQGEDPVAHTRLLPRLHEPDDDVPQMVPVLPWALALGALLIAPVVAWNSGRPDSLSVVGGLSVGLHLVLQLTAKRPIWTAVLAPPLAWADLLAERAAPTPRRADWASAMFLGGLALALTPVALRLASPGTTAAAVTASTVGGAALLAAMSLLPRTQGPEAAVLRLLALPFWAVGVAIQTVLSVPLLPFAVAAGRWRELFLRIGRAWVSGVEAFLPPRFLPST